MQWMHASQGPCQNFKKKTETEVEARRECIFLDVTRPFLPSIGGSQFDAKIVDQFS